MKFAIITHAIHKQENKKLFSYEPYVREMNLWLKNVDKTRIVAPLSSAKVSKIESQYTESNVEFKKIPSFNVLSGISALKSIFKIPVIAYQIFKAMFWADHIHLRCPGNVGLIGCVVQIVFPNKPKTVKYAGNWDPKSRQPWSYRLQKKILANTSLTKNCKVLVYGEWENQTKNIVPFFTASYSQEDIKDIPEKDLNETIKLLFVGTFSKGKQPLLSVKTAEQLLQKGYNIQLDMYGEGEEFTVVENYIQQHDLNDKVILHKNQPKDVVKRAYQSSHFLIFISKSEGWPKVVAEAMFWQCLPISTRVSCVPYMLDNGNRGGLVDDNLDAIVDKVEFYIKNKAEYKTQIEAAKHWSQQFTLNTFATEIKKLL